MAAQPHPRVTPEEYLEVERAAGFRSEYYNGRMYAMAGGTVRHATIISNLAFGLHSSVGQRKRLVLTSDVRIRVSPVGLYTYPGVVVVCGEPEFADGRKDTLLNPILLIEVVSSSLEAYDRGFKSANIERLRRSRSTCWCRRRKPGSRSFAVNSTGTGCSPNR